MKSKKDKLIALLVCYIKLCLLHKTSLIGNVEIPIGCYHGTNPSIEI